jgi:hypothetical protein
MTDTTTPRHHHADRRSELHAYQRAQQPVSRRGRRQGHRRGQHRRAPRDRRPGARLAGGLVLLAAVAAVATLATACTTASRPALTSGSPPSTGPAATVTEVPQPAAGHNGPVLTVNGTVYWVATGYPGCAMLHTPHGQVLELVDAAHSPRGPVIHQRQQAAAAGHGPARQAVQVVGFVPAGVVSACGGAMSFSVEQVTP